MSFTSLQRQGPQKPTSRWLGSHHWLRRVCQNVARICNSPRTCKACPRCLKGTVPATHPILSSLRVLQGSMGALTWCWCSHREEGTRRGLSHLAVPQVLQSAVGSSTQGMGCSSIGCGQHPPLGHGSALGPGCCSLRPSWPEPSWRVWVLGYPGATGPAGAGTLLTEGGAKPGEIRARGDV